MNKTHEETSKQKLSVILRSLKFEGVICILMHSVKIQWNFKNMQQ